MRFSIYVTLRLLILATSGIALCIGIFGTSAAQTGTAAAALNGTVRDPSGAMVAGATITLTSTGTGFKQVAESDPKGNYFIVNIAPGTCAISASKEGISAEKVSDFTLAVNQTATINFDLAVGAASISVVV